MKAHSVLLVSSLAAFGLAFADEGQDQAPEAVPEAITGPMVVWDAETREWLTLTEYGKRLIKRGTRGVVIEQVPFTRQPSERQKVAAVDLLEPLTYRSRYECRDAGSLVWGCK